MKHGRSSVRMRYPMLATMPCTCSNMVVARAALHLYLPTRVRALAFFNSFYFFAQRLGGDAAKVNWLTRNRGTFPYSIQPLSLQAFPAAGGAVPSHLKRRRRIPNA